MIVSTILNGLIQFDFDLRWIAGVCAWMSAVMLFFDTNRVLKIQVGAILAVGTGLIMIAHTQGGLINIDAIVSSNTGLMTMIASVGFLRLVVVSDLDTDSQLPVGPRSFLRTLIGLNIASSIINVSAPILIADRIHEHTPLKRFTAQTITRVFCGVSNWSPFFGAMAVVLTYVSNASLSTIMLIGFPFTLLGFVCVYFDARWRFADEVESFVGYPMHVSALKIPALLIAVVLVLAAAMEATPVLVTISIGAIVVTVSALLVQHGISASCHRLGQHITDGLPRIVNELCLFLAAGVLATGMSALISHGLFENPFTVFDATTASTVLGIIILCAFCGIHPIIMISSFSPMLLSLEPNPNLLAITYLLGWHLGTCSNPLSGTNLVFQGRYGIAAWRLAIWNWPYAGAMFFAAVLWLHVSSILITFLE
ncbi:MAG: hypothetical protein AAF434_10150 [Pseudomonadota bacterium]